MIQVVSFIFLISILIFLLYYRYYINSLKRGVYYPPGAKNKEKANVLWFKSVLPKAKKSMMFIAGEMNPIAYEQVNDKLENALNRGISVTIVFGPKLCVRDVELKALNDGDYEDTSQIHPVFKLASKFPDQVKLYVPNDSRKNKSEQRNAVHSGVVDSRHSCIEDCHDELDERGITFYKNESISKQVGNNITLLINKNRVREISPYDYDINNLVSYSEMKKHEGGEFQFQNIKFFEQKEEIITEVGKEVEKRNKKLIEDLKRDLNL